MLFQLFFYAAEQWHPVAIHAKILANKILNWTISAKKNEKKKKLALLCHLFLYASKYSLKTCKPQTNFKDLSRSLMHKSVLTPEYICVLVGMHVRILFCYVTKNKLTFLSVFKKNLFAIGFSLCGATISLYS